MAAARGDAFALFDTMMALRRQRAGMMQTRDQLLFCYLTVLDRATPLFTDTAVDSLAYYHGPLPAEDAARALAKAAAGAFLVRDDDAQSSEFVVVSVHTGELFFLAFFPLLFVCF